MILSKKKIVGIIPVKGNSKRFKNKNIYPFKNKPMFLHAVDCMKNSKIIDEIYIMTDSDKIKEICIKNSVNFIERGPNKIEDEEPIFDVIKFGYESLKKKFNYSVTILANSIFHHPKDILRALNLIEKKKLLEIRSFDKSGVENGLLILNTQVFKKYKEISKYIGAIQTKGKEIHFKSEIIKYD